MKYKKVAFLTLKLFFIAMGILFFNTLEINAEEGKITVYPPKENISINSGEKIRKSLMVVNSSDKAVTLKVSVRDFRVVDETGKIEFYDNDEYPAKKWLIPQYELITIGAVDSKNMDYIVSAEKSMPGRGYAGAIVFQEYDAKSKNTTGIPFGTQVRLNIISKGITTGGKIEYFTSPLLQFGNKMDIGFKVRNPSNSNLLLSGNVIFKDIFGKETGSFKTGRLDVYPGNSRNFKFQWTDSPAFGVYFATVNLVDELRNDNTISSWSVVAYFPLKRLIVAFFAVFLVSLIMALLYLNQVKKVSVMSLALFIKGKLSLISNLRVIKKH